jgi:allantoin racemase
MMERCSGVRHVLEEREMTDSVHDSMDKLRAGDPELVERVVISAQAALLQDGADVIVLGCTCMAPVADQVARQVGAPVVDAMVSGYIHAESLLRMRLSQSAVAYPRPAQARLDAVAALVEGKAQPAGEDHCSVCVTAAE